MRDPLTTDRVRRLIADQFGLVASDLQPEQSLADLGADSLDRIELAMACEDEFAIDVADDALGPATTVQAVIDLCERLTAARAEG
jgi:acyl carrier protein